MSEASDKIATGLNEAGAEATKAFAEGVEAAMDTLQDAWTADMSLPEALQALGALSDIAQRIPPRRATPEAALPVGVKGLDDDQIMEIIKEVAPWKDEPKLNDLLTYEKSPPLFPQATYDVPSYRAIKFVRAVEARIRSALIPAPQAVVADQFRQSLAAAKQAVAEAPGHTDLMATPEEIDRFVEANPPPAPAPERLELIERLRKGAEALDEAASTLDGSALEANAALANLLDDAAAFIAALSQPERGKAEPSEARGFDLCVSRGLAQWFASLKRPDLDDEARVMGALTAAVTQAVALGLLDQATASTSVKAGEPSEADVEALPMETAPHDGSIVRLLVSYDRTDMAHRPLHDSPEPAWTIGMNSRDHTGEDLWQIVGWDWEQDCFRESGGTPIGWLPFHDKARALAYPPGQPAMDASMTAKLTDEQRRILRSLADQPDGSCRTNWLPDDIDYTAYRECRDLGLLDESTGRGGFLVSAITPAGRAALEAKEGGNG